MAKTGIVEFFRQVRQEASKVTWSTRKETVMTTAIVLVLVAITSVFFMVVDTVIFNATQAIMGF